jgi:DNA invertase Pin-like site-specific DNA recombinase
MSNPDVTGRSPADNTLPRSAATVPGRRSTSLSDRHLSKLAIVYVRQSSVQQIFEHKESRERQYALADYAAILGWPRERIVVIDEDQGRSGRTAEQRPGFQRLLAEVTLDHVGLVLGLELSRLSRSSKDWYHLLELCAIFGTLLADQDGIYDANDSNDRLVLGLKGTMSEVELTTMRNRLERGKLHKARRGELTARRSRCQNISMLAQVSRWLRNELELGTSVTPQPCSRSPAATGSLPARTTHNSARSGNCSRIAVKRRRPYTGVPRSRIFSLKTA